MTKMKRKLVTLLLILFSTTFNGFTQIKLFGTVKDEKNNPINCVKICEQGTNNCLMTDIYGRYEIKVINPEINNLIFSHSNFFDVIIDSLIDNRRSFNVIMIEDTLKSEGKLKERKRRTNNNWGFTLSVGIEGNYSNFSEFLDILGDYNVKLMNELVTNFKWNFLNNYKDFLFGVHYGTGGVFNSNHDSLNLDFEKHLLGLNFGYRIINSNKIVLTPMLSMQWERFKLINSDITRKITFEQYLEDRDLDIRFNQIMGFAGLYLSIKDYKSFIIKSDYWSYGLYGGYAFLLNESPWIYSKGNRLENNLKINKHNLNFGFIVSFHFE